MIIAVDFDGTLADTDATRIYTPNENLIAKLIILRQKGNKVILWTCREGDRLNDAIEFCRKYGLEFDAVNDNLSRYKAFNLNPRKIFANIYIDDAASGVDEFLKDIETYMKS